MCVDPISLTALGTAALSTISSIGSAIGIGGAAAGATAAGAAAGGGLSTFGVASIIGGGVASAAGTYIQMKGQEAAAKQDAANTTAAGYAAESDYRAKAAADMATQLATLSDRGAAISTGSPLELIRESARNSEINALRIRANALNTAAGYTTQAKGYATAAPISAAGQLLGTASKLAELGAI